MHATLRRSKIGFDSRQGHCMNDAEITQRGGGLQSRFQWYRLPPASPREMNIGSIAVGNNAIVMGSDGYVACVRVDTIKTESDVQSHHRTLAGGRRARNHDRGRH